MHEMSLAINIVDIACRTAKQNGAGRVNSIEVEVGRLAGVLADSLSFCFQAARANTSARNSELNIITVPGRGQCRTCDHDFEINSFFTLCPFCRGLAVDIVAGKELKINAINVD